MTKNKPAHATTDDIKEIVDLLDSRFADGDSIVEEVAKLREAIEKLTRTVQVLGETIDDLRGDFEWIVHNPEKLRTATGVRPVTSIPTDPLAKDFPDRVNRYTAVDLPPELRGPDPGVPAASPGQPELF